MVGLRTFPCDISWIAERNKLVQVKKGKKNIMTSPLFSQSFTMFWLKTKVWRTETVSIWRRSNTKRKNYKGFLSHISFQFNFVLSMFHLFIWIKNKNTIQPLQRENKTKPKKPRSFSKAVYKNNCCNPNFWLVLV